MANPRDGVADPELHIEIIFDDRSIGISIWFEILILIQKNHKKIEY